MERPGDKAASQLANFAGMHRLFAHQRNVAGMSIALTHLAIVTRTVPIVAVVGPVRAAGISSYEVRREIDVSECTRGSIKVKVGPLKRHKCVLGAVVVVHRVAVWLSGPAPVLAISAKEVRRHRAAAARRELEVRVSVVDDVPVASGVDPEKRVLDVVLVGRKPRVRYICVH